MLHRCKDGNKIDEQWNAIFFDECYEVLEKKTKEKHEKQDLELSEGISCSDNSKTNDSVKNDASENVSE